ncbi:MAG: type II toxin-antitoxin system RelB/DinJ family antitoxin [Lachnospiraceae bacterium]|jgi:addiction module RelB/DinJ family antitoxin|nr:type II toxin-antitoxin system RelB/DinJ family antitoxin [Lachnospiraceae bacterium]
MSVQISTRIDETTKHQFEDICEVIGISPSNALSLFIKGVINYKGIPFNVTAPQKKAVETVQDDIYGCMRGKMWMSDDFDAPLKDFEEYM